MEQNENNGINVDEYLRSLCNRLDSKTKAVLVSSVVFGLLAHGMALFNKYSIHDDIVNLFDVGSTYSLGRWFLQFLSQVSGAFFQSHHYSLPLVKGIASIICIGISSVLVIKILRIRYVVTSVIIVAMMIVFPVWAAIFGYMFTAPYYAFSVLISTVGVFILCKKPRTSRFIIATLLVSCGVGIYQAFVPYTLALMCFFLLEKIYSDTEDKKILLRIAYLAAAVICFFALYFGITKLLLMYMQCELSTYQHVNSMGQEGIRIYIERILTAFRYFWHPRMLNHMYPMNTVALYYISTGICTILLIFKAFIFIRSRKLLRAILLFAIALSLPISVNFIAVMCQLETVHCLMCYGQVMPFILLAWIIEKTHFKNMLYNKHIYGFGCVALILTLITYCRYDNVYYLKYGFVQNQLISYYNTLITQIKSCKGYRAEYPITFIGKSFTLDTSRYKSTEFECDMYPLSGGFHPSKYSMMAVMSQWCGYRPVISEASSFKDLPEVKAMPVYPNEGSIKIINKTVVIKIHEQS